MSEQKLQVFAFGVRYLWYIQQDIDFKDAPHDLTNLEIPVLGSDVINGPKLFEFFEDTLGTARKPYCAFYSYVTRMCILSINDGDDLFGFF